MARKKLKNAPLKEAVFELYWKLPNDRTNFPYDPEFDIAQGKFDDIIVQKFPVHKRIPENLNIRIHPKPAHQYWKGELSWPVIQYGPGILTLNDTDVNYVWADNFRPNIEFAIESLIRSYKKLPVFNKMSLRYIDSVDFMEDDKIKFIKDNLQTDLINGYNVPGKLSGLNINQIFSLEDGTKMNINIQTAKNNKNLKDAIVWVTGAERFGEVSKSEIYSWVDETHTLLSTTFVNMLNPDFYGKFD